MQTVNIMDKDAIPHVINVGAIKSTEFYKKNLDSEFGAKTDYVIVRFIAGRDEHSDVVRIDCESIEHVRHVMTQLATASTVLNEYIMGKMGL